ncbi:MAG TPA: SAM-dependent methyltransferase [Acetobacteraceae bacterium]|jgi:SAM-dependent methyltransferase|nr:SAM-dependent methyltransferase [Acetobacteraceae bacterium]
MAQHTIRFDDGAAYERGMGIWSQLAGQVFLDWLASPPGLRWIDVGCGNGAFTELLVQRHAPAEVQGIDPSEAQLKFARTRPAVQGATFLQGDAMALPFGNGRFDAAVMALVIFFVPDPAKGVAEMARVVGPGGTVAAYAWDLLGGGLPFAPIHAEFRALGFTPPLPPSADVSRIAALREVWTGAGLEGIETREITVRRSFSDFDEYWSTSVAVGSMQPMLAEMAVGDVEQLKDRVRARLSVDATGRVTHHARANAIKGRVPKAP